ncbi:hypothetical protein FQN50_008622 [Emmonsiellopsis sp. PD_5]|nr:hypothetical protein FQN50_008622 [Emmonsiellopsis sp. PD_5]
MAKESPEQFQPPTADSPQAAIPTFSISDHSRPYEALSKYLTFENLDHHEWWRHGAPMLSKMLSDANYDIHHQFQHLCLFGLHIVPLLGPFPAARSGPYRCLLGGFGSLEFSENFTGSEATIRIGFEPTAHTAGASSDPANRLIINEALSRLKKVDPQMDLRLYHQLVNELAINDQEETLLRDRDELEKQPSKSQTILALDLKGGAFTAKLYLFPILKSAATGRSLPHLVSNAIRKVDERGAFKDSLAMIEDYLQTTPATTSICYLSCDLVDPEKTRLKIYIEEDQVMFGRVSDIWTMGGKLTDKETMTGLQMLRELWTALEIIEGVRMPVDRATILGDGPDILPLLFNFETRPFQKDPKLKIYIPLVGVNDMEIARVLSEFFAKYGMSEHADSYTRNWMSYWYVFRSEENIYKVYVTETFYSQATSGP